MKLPLEIEKIIEISDPVYSFCEIIDCIDLNSYFVKKGYKTGRPRYNRENLLKVILFSFMENGYLSLRGIEKACKTDIRYMYLLDDMTAPTFATIWKFIRENLSLISDNFRKSLLKWLDEHDLEQREKMISTVFKTLEESGIKNLNDFFNLKNAITVIRNVNNIDEETKNLVISLIEFNLNNIIDSK